jgi:hypothetical protein
MELYLHVRGVLSILVGLSLARLLSGAAQLAQPERKRVYWVHLAWMLFMFFYVIAFWWWEFELRTVSQWTFPVYVTLIMYGVLVYFLCALLSPESLKDYEGFKHYFYSRRKWFFGAMAVMFLVDIYDSYVKGLEHVLWLGNLYKWRIGLFFVWSLAAIKIRNERFHAVFVVVAVLSEIAWYLRQYFTFIT